MSVQSFDHDSRRVHLPARLADRSHLLPAISGEQAAGVPPPPLRNRPMPSVPLRPSAPVLSPDNLHALRGRVGDE